MAVIIRWTLSATLLVVVWQHSHWSVALVITLLTVNGELVAANVERRRK